MNRYQLEGAVILLGMCIVATLIVAAIFWTAINIGNYEPEWNGENASEYEASKQAYCYQVYGNASVERRPHDHNDFVDDSGQHCMANENGTEPHLHDVSDAAREESYQANMSDRQANFSGIERYKDNSYPGSTLLDVGWIFSVFGVVLAALYGLGLVGDDDG